MLHPLVSMRRRDENAAVDADPLAANLTKRQNARPVRPSVADTPSARHAEWQAQRLDDIALPHTYGNALLCSGVAASD